MIVRIKSEEKIEEKIKTSIFFQQLTGKTHDTTDCASWWELRNEYSIQSPICQYKTLNWLKLFYIQDNKRPRKVEVENNFFLSRIIKNQGKLKSKIKIFDMLQRHQIFIKCEMAEKYRRTRAYCLSFLCLRKMKLNINGFAELVFLTCHFSTQAQLVFFINSFLDTMTKLIGRDTKFLCLFT